MIGNPMIVGGGAELPSWIRTTMPIGPGRCSVTYGNGKFVAVTNDYSAAYIKDSYDEWA